jgi:hypothetical protein
MHDIIKKSQARTTIADQRSQEEGSGLGVPLLCYLASRGRLALMAVLLLVGGGMHAEPPPSPLPMPPNVERLVVRTSSRENREVPFYLRRPAGYVRGQASSQTHRVLLMCPYLNQDGLALLQPPSPFLDVADERGWFIVVPTFHTRPEDVRNRDLCYYYPEKFSGKAVLDALDMIRKKYPVDTERLFLQGYSGGAQFVHRFAIWAPDRVAAVAVNSSSWFDQPKEKSKQTAWLVTIGDSDPAYENSLAFVDKLRGIGALPVLRSYIAVEHWTADGGGVKPLDCAFFTFYDDVTKTMLGKPKPLLATKPAPMIAANAMPYVGDAQDWRYYKNTTDAAQEIPAESRVYLPSEGMARLWGEAEGEQQFAATGR